MQCSGWQYPNDFFGKRNTVASQNTFLGPKALDSTRARLISGVNLGSLYAKTHSEKCQNIDTLHGATMKNRHVFVSSSWTKRQSQLVLHHFMHIKATYYAQVQAFQWRIAATRQHVGKCLMALRGLLIKKLPLTQLWYIISDEPFMVELIY